MGNCLDVATWVVKAARTRHALLEAVLLELLRQESLPPGRRITTATEASLQSAAHTLFIQLGGLGGAHRCPSLGWREGVPFSHL